MQRQGLEPAKRVAYFEYNFDRDGGAVGDIDMRGDALPEGAIVTSGMVHVVAAVTSDGAATVALKLLGAGDILAATAKASLTANALIDTVPVGTAALKTGKIVCALEYL